MKVDNKDIIKIMQIIKSSMYGIEYYDRKKILNLCNELLKIKYRNLIDIQDHDGIVEKCEKIKRYIMENGVNVRREYFEKFIPQKDYVYRTAYNALLNKSAICIGYAELTSILLNLYDIKSYTLIATLPYRLHPAIHYFNVAEYIDEYGITKYIPIDVEREVSRIKKGECVEEYFEKMTISYPTEEWTKHKIEDWGLGIPGNEYMKKAKHKYLGMSNLPKIMRDYKRHLNKEREEER